MIVRTQDEKSLVITDQLHVQKERASSNSLAGSSSSMMIGLAADDSAKGFALATDFGTLNIGAIFLDGFGSDV